MVVGREHEADAARLDTGGHLFGRQHDVGPQRFQHIRQGARAKDKQAITANEKVWSDDAHTLQARRDMLNGRRAVLMREAMKAMFEEGELCPGLDRFSLQQSDLLRAYEQMGAVYMDNLPRGGFDTPVKELIGVNARQITAWNGSFSVLKDDLDALSDRGNRTCVIFAGRTPHSRGALPMGPSLSLNGQMIAASAPDVASQLPSCDHENERVLDG